MEEAQNCDGVPFCSGCYCDEDADGERSTTNAVCTMVLFMESVSDSAVA